MVKNYQSDAVVVRNQQIQGDYYKMQLKAPEIASIAQAGQFIHLQVPNLEHRVLRRPFSISNADPETGLLTIVYKVVGTGTLKLKSISEGVSVSLLGPLGNGFAPLPAEKRSILIGGGYGCAAIYLLARKAPIPPMILLGGRSAGDLIMIDEFKALGCEVRLSTDDGTAGEKGRVTLLLEQALAEFTPGRISACGPVPMLKAVAKQCDERQLDCEVSMDSVMCCGMGACFACVIKQKADNDQGWSYARACEEGPVFKSTQVYWE